MKSKLMFYGRNVMDGVAIAAKESLRFHFEVASNNRKSFLTLVLMLLQINFLFAQSTYTADNGTSLTTTIKSYAVPIYVIGGAILGVVFVYQVIQTISKGLGGDSNAWKEFGRTGVWLLVWLLVVPFIYKMLMGRISSSALDGTN